MIKRAEEQKSQSKNEHGGKKDDAILDREIKFRFSP